MGETRPFAGYKFLIIEDEMLQAWHICDILAELGAHVGKVAFTYTQGEEALAEASWDCAIVDINLHGEAAFPLVAMMEKQGIPYVYCSAYIDALVEIFPEAQKTVRVSKPATVEKIRDAVLLALDSRKPNAGCEPPDPPSAV
jgi:DNA-binding NtrC family response regulator